MQWYERLSHACDYEAESIEKEHEHFRKEAKEAPLKELELFLSSPSGKYQAHARAVMEQVYKERSQKLHEQKAFREGRAAWWRGLAQQISSQVIGTLLIGMVVGFITGVWFCGSGSS